MSGESLGELKRRQIDGQLVEGKKWKEAQTWEEF